MQAGQDLSIGGRQSNAQYQYTIQSDNLQDLVQWGPVLLQQMRKIADAHRRQYRPAEQRSSGHCLSMTVRPLSRLGITPQMLDNSLYEAFGQAQVSTMYTGINQYHVVMEVAPTVLAVARRTCKTFISEPRKGELFRCQRHRPLRAVHRSAGRESPGAISLGHHFLQSGPWRSPQRRFDGPSSPWSRESACRNTIHGMFSGTLQAFQSSLATRTVSDHHRSHGRLHRPRHSLRELHPSHHDSLHAALGGSRRRAGAHALSQRISASSR